MFAVRWLVILGAFFGAFPATAAVLCSQVHQLRDAFRITDSANHLTSHENKFLSENMGTFSKWLGETKSLESVEGIVVDSQASGARFTFQDKVIRIKPQFMNSNGKRDLGTTLTILFHEYSHAHLEKTMLQEIPAYRLWRATNSTPTLMNRSAELITGVHEMVADIFPAMLVRDPNLINQMLQTLDVASSTYSRDTFAKIISSRKFKDNEFESPYRWLFEMDRIAWLDGKWEHYMLYSFLRPRIWTNVETLMTTKGPQDAQRYIKVWAQKMISEILSGRLISTGSTMLTLEGVQRTTDAIFTEVNREFGL